MNFNNIALSLALMNTNTTLANVLLCNAILNDDLCSKHKSDMNTYSENYKHKPDFTNNEKIEQEKSFNVKPDYNIKKEPEILPNVRPIQKELLKEDWYINFCKRTNL